MANIPNGHDYVWKDLNRRETSQWEVQLGELQSPTPGKEEPHAIIYAWGCLDDKGFGRKWPGEKLGNTK